MAVPRVVIAFLGIWLIISAALLPHSPQQMKNAWIVGVASTVIAAISITAPAARYFNAALAVWLFLSAAILPTVSSAMAWNSVIVAVLMFVLSLLGGERLSWPGGRARA